ncbi:unnamed protein product [Urochloa humidicola]
MDGGGFTELPPPTAASDSADVQCHALLYNLSVLREKVQQLQPLVGLAVQHGGPVAAVSSTGAVIQETRTGDHHRLLLHDVRLRSRADRVSAEPSEPRDRGLQQRAASRDAYVGCEMERIAGRCPRSAPCARRAPKFGALARSQVRSVCVPRLLELFAASSAPRQTGETKKFSSERWPLGGPSLL